MLTAGLSALFGAFGAAAAAPARAAAGNPLLLGRTNSAGSAQTVVTSSNPLHGLLARGTVGSAALFETTATGKWGARARNTSTTAAARGGALLAEGGQATGVRGTTGSGWRYGLHGMNSDAVAREGGAVRAEGRRNVGLFADTAQDVDDVPALVALGGDGEFAGIAMVAGGTSYLDGQVKALRSYVGVLGTGQQVEYAPVVSGELDYHTVSGATALVGGSATVTLPEAFVGTVTMSTLRVIGLVPVGVAMPDLHATVTGSDEATGFGIAGGVGTATVHWTVSAVRLELSLRAPTAAAASAPPSPAAARPGDGARLPRQEVGRPTR